MNLSIKKKTGLALSATAALLLSACASDDDMGDQQTMKQDGDMGQCHGVNSCKGTSACATAESSCSGQNSCKGKGWVPSNAADCEAKGGEFKQP